MAGRTDRLFAAALRKHFLAERMTRQERSELRRRGALLPDGSVMVPQPEDATTRMKLRLIDPRTLR